MRLTSPEPSRTFDQFLMWRRPMRFWLLVIVFIAGAAALLVGSAWGMDNPIWLPLALIGVAMMAYVITTAKRSLRRLQDDLLAGKDVIGRWLVSQDDLDSFLDIDRERGKVGAEYRNLLNFPKTVPPEGLPVIIGKRDWLIGDRLYRGSPPGGTLFCCVAQVDGDPGFIEFATVSRSSGAGHFLTLSRLPVPVSTRVAAKMAEDKLAGAVPPSNFERLKRSFPNYVSNVSPLLHKSGRLA